MDRQCLLIRRLIIKELIAKAVIGTRYEEMHNKIGKIPNARYIEDEVLKFLSKELEDICKELYEIE